jgi:hypothetical protein
MRVSVIAGVIAPCCLLAACSSSGTNTGSLSAGSLSGNTPPEILALTTTAITATGFSFHFIDESRVGSMTTTLTGDDTAAGADQTLSGSAAALTVERQTDGHVFVKGAPSALQSALGLSAVTAGTEAGKWISLSSGDRPYGQVTAALDPQQELNTFVPTSPFTVEKPRRFHGRTVVGVTGKARSSAGAGSAHMVTLFVPTRAPFTPVGATLTFGNGSGAGVEAVVFDRWGQRIDPPTPSGVVAYSSLS